MKKMPSQVFLKWLLKVTSPKRSKVMLRSFWCRCGSFCVSLACCRLPTWQKFTIWPFFIHEAPKALQAQLLDPRLHHWEPPSKHWNFVRRAAPHQERLHPAHSWASMQFLLWPGNSIGRLNFKEFTWKAVLRCRQHLRIISWQCQFRKPWFAILSPNHPKQLSQCHSNQGRQWCQHARLFKSFYSIFSRR